MGVLQLLLLLVEQWISCSYKAGNDFPLYSKACMLHLGRAMHHWVAYGSFLVGIQGTQKSIGLRAMGFSQVGTLYIMQGRTLNVTDGLWYISWSGVKRPA
jgi:hypothetical protein